MIDSVALGEEINHDRSMEWTELIISWPRAERDEEEVAEAPWPSLRAMLPLNESHIMKLHFLKLPFHLSSIKLGTKIFNKWAFEGHSRYRT